MRRVLVVDDDRPILEAIQELLAEEGFHVAGTDRPWLGADPLHALQELYAGRELLYQSVASLVVDVDVAAGSVCQAGLAPVRSLVFDRVFGGRGR